MNNQVLEDEIDIREVFGVINQYKKVIITFIVISSIIAAIYAYFKPSIYISSATVEVGIEQTGGGVSKQDILAAATGGSASSADTEMDIIKSRFLASKALEKVDLNHRYYGTRLLKERELYKNSPFDVNLTKGEDISFDLYPIDQTFFRLEASGVDKQSKEKWSYDKVHRYGTEIAEDRFAFVVTKKESKELDLDHYRFVIMSPESAVDQAAAAVSVAPLSEQSAILRITYEDEVPLRAQEYADALAESYIEQSVYQKTQEASKTLEFVDNQLLEISENLKTSAQQLEKFKIQTSMISLEAKAQGVVERMAAYETQLAEINIEEKLLDSLYSQVRYGKDLETLSVAGLNDKGGSGAALATLVKELQETVLKAKMMRGDFTEEYPEVKKLTRQSAQLKAIIIDTIKNMKNSISERKGLIEKTMTAQEKLLSELPQDEKEFGKLQRKFVINEKIYSYLLEQRSATAIAKASTVSKNRVVDEATYPDKPSKPNKNLIVMAGLMLGLILGIAYAFISEFLDDTIKNEGDIAKGTHAGILGSIPNFRDNKEGSLRVFRRPKSSATEAFRNVRTNLQFMAHNEGSQVIMVTSTIAGEGKTSVSSSLAGVISMTGKKVVVINLDMRKPTLHKVFGLPNNEGISTVLSNNALLADTIQHTAYENLDIISSGPIPPNPSELIQGKRMDDVIAKLKSVYDVIILDTPPVGLVTDAHALMRIADTTVYVVRAGYAKKGFLKGIEKLYSSEGVHGFAIVLNDVNVERHGYGYGYGYGGGYYEEKS